MKADDFWVFFAHARFAIGRGRPAIGTSGEHKVGMAMGSADGTGHCMSDMLGLSRLLQVCEMDLVLLDGEGPGAVVHRVVHDEALLCTGQTRFACRGRFLVPANAGLIACIQHTDESASWCHGAPLSSGSLITLAPRAASEFVLSAGTALTVVVVPLRHWQQAGFVASAAASEHLQLPAGDPGLQPYAALGERIAGGSAAMAGVSLREVLEQHAASVAQAGQHGRAVSGRGRRAHYRILRRAEDFMQANLRHNLYINDICAAAGVSERALRYAFDDLLGMSPNRYLSMLRLCTAYRALASADDERGSVKAIALSCGLWDLSRFAENYRRVFGELPRDTLMRSSG